MAGGAETQAIAQLEAGLNGHTSVGDLGGDLEQDVVEDVARHGCGLEWAGVWGEGEKREEGRSGDGERGVGREEAAQAMKER